MIEQIDDQKIILGLTRIISDFLSLHLPKNEPDRFLEPYVPYNLKGKIRHPSDLLNEDLYCSLRVLIGNDRYFRERQLYVDGTIHSCARIVLSYRNRLAHKRLNEEILLEQMQLEYVSISRLASLLPTSTEVQKFVEELKTYVGSILLFVAKEHFNTEIANGKIIELKLRSTDRLKIDDNIDEEFTANNVRLTISECKSQLRRLRDEIQKEISDMPKFRNILRESLIDTYVEQRVSSLENFRNIFPEREYAKTDERQFVHFDKIAEIINRL